MRILKQFIIESVNFIYQVYASRNLISTLSLRDFKQIYVKNFFGFLWAILDPLAFVVILYYVFQARFGSKNPNEIPFGVYLLTGYVAFDFFSSSVMAVTNSIKEHSFLLKKINFRVAILPIVAVFTNLMVHGIVLFICCIVIVSNHIFPTVYWLQVFYYIFALSFFLISVGWLTSSIYLFFPDIRNIVNIVTRILFFLTPIFWRMDGLAVRDQFILKLNPVYYIVNGYRECLLYNKGFWDHPMLTLYFWSLCLFFLLVGVTIFKKLRPHFADVVA